MALLQCECDMVNVMNLMVTHDSVLMVSFSCSHRPGVCITRPNCKARSDRGEGRGGGRLD